MEPAYKSQGEIILKVQLTKRDIIIEQRTSKIEYYKAQKELALKEFDRKIQDQHDKMLKEIAKIQSTIDYYTKITIPTPKID
jgi:hypothetical protein